MKKNVLSIVTAACLSAGAAHAQIVINEVFAGGGDAGAPFNQDYIELFNSGAVAVEIGGYQLTYASAGSPFFSNVIIFGSGSIGPGEFFVITASAVGANGAAVPNVTQMGAPGDLATTGGKIRFTDNSGTPITLDFVGWGDADAQEGAGTAPAMANTNSIQRFPNGTDSNNNNLDFQLSDPSPGAANVPEPATYMLIGLGVLICGKCFRRKRS
jgi:hypothetical protein